MSTALAAVRPNARSRSVRSPLAALVAALALSAACAAPAGAATITEFPLEAGSNPSSITSGPDGALWFVEQGARRIGRITTDGRVSSVALPPGTSPWRITAGSDALFYTDRIGGGIGRIEPDGRVTSVSAYACAPRCTAGGARAPNDIAVATDGRPWFSVDILFTSPGPNQAYHEVCSLAANLDPGDCTKVDNVIVPSGHATAGPTLGPDGAMWFTNKYEDIVGRIPTSGSREIRKFGVRNLDAGAITAGPDGALWITEIQPNRISRITTGGGVGHIALPRPRSVPTSITAGPDGAVWFTEFGEGKAAIGRIAPGGQLTEYPLPDPNSSPEGIVTGPDGALWFTENRGNRIGRLVPDTVRPPADAAPPGGPGRILGVKPRSVSVPLRGRRSLAVRLDLARGVRVVARLQRPPAGGKRRTLASASRVLAAGRRSLRVALPRGLRAGKLQVVVELVENGRVGSRTTLPFVAKGRR